MANDGYYTSYSFVHARDLSPDNIQRGLDGNLWIIRDRQKTETVEDVPLLPIALEIIDKYKDHLCCNTVLRKMVRFDYSDRHPGYLGLSALHMEC